MEWDYEEIKLYFMSQDLKGKRKCREAPIVPMYICANLLVNVVYLRSVSPVCAGRPILEKSARLTSNARDNSRIMCASIYTFISTSCSIFYD